MFKDFVREGELRCWAPWIAAALLILAFVALQTAMEGVCWDEDAVKAAKINEAAGCFEFWFNRYQSVIGAVAAVGAAGSAWIGIQRQIDKTDEAIAASNRQSAIASLPVMDVKISDSIQIFRSADNIARLSTETLQIVRKAFERADRVRQAIARNSDIRLPLEEYRQATRDFESQVNQLAKSIEEFIYYSFESDPEKAFFTACRDLCLNVWRREISCKAFIRDLDLHMIDPISPDLDKNNFVEYISNIDYDRFEHNQVLETGKPLQYMASYIKNLQSERDTIFENIRK